MVFWGNGNLHAEPTVGVTMMTLRSNSSMPSRSVMIRPISKYGAPELEKESPSVSEFDDELKSLAEDMLETMYAGRGVGLAAPQVGVNLRLIVVDPTGGEERGHQLILVNPEVVDESGQQKEEEGCLSFPEITAVVERPQQIRVTAQNLDGDRFEVVADNLLARAICHEIDHLDGVLFIDRISILKRDMIKRRVRKLVKAGDWR
jgi:peptide deformylase